MHTATDTKSRTDAPSRADLDEAMAVLKGRIGESLGEDRPYWQLVNDTMEKVRHAAEACTVGQVVSFGHNVIPGTPEGRFYLGYLMEEHGYKVLDAMVVTWSDGKLRVHLEWDDYSIHLCENKAKDSGITNGGSVGKAAEDIKNS